MQRDSKVAREHRGLHFKRVGYRPGFGVCRCSVCSEAAERQSRSLAPRHLPPIGSPVTGCVYLNREQVFAEEWAEQNQRVPGLNYGQGLLQDLMVTQRDARPGDLAVRDHHRFFRRLRVAFGVTLRERVIVATVIQWLGSNVGWCFLEKCINRCGYDLVKRQEKEVKRAT
jgi:hypothetical protein